MSKIDVSKCIFFDKSIYAIEGKLNFCIVNHDNCYKFKDCYYKQLQQLKAENEELKVFIKEDLSPTCQRLGKENEQYRFLVGEINKDRIEYKNALDEIEKIVNAHYGTILEFYKANKKILQKIKEVKGE